MATCFDDTVILRLKDNIKIQPHIFRCFHKITNGDYQLHHVLPSVCPFAKNDSVPTGFS